MERLKRKWPEGILVIGLLTSYLVYAGAQFLLLKTGVPPLMAGLLAVIVAILYIFSVMYAVTRLRLRFPYRSQ